MVLNLSVYRIPSGRSLFDLHLENLNTGGNDNIDFANTCKCTTTPTRCDASVVLDSTPNMWEPNNTVTPNVPANAAVGGSDHIDYEYNSTTDFTQFFVMKATRSSRLLQQDQATDHCNSVLWNNNAIRPSCTDYLAPSEIQAVVDKCVQDVQVRSFMSNNIGLSQD